MKIEALKDIYGYGVDNNTRLQLGNMQYLHSASPVIHHLEEKQAHSMEISSLSAENVGFSE